VIIQAKAAWSWLEIIRENLMQEIFCLLDARRVMALSTGGAGSC
jgi:hypothetical protein